MSPADHRVVLIFILLCGPFVSRWAGLCVARASAIFCPVPVAADGPLPARGLRSSYATSACAVLSLSCHLCIIGLVRFSQPAIVFFSHAKPAQPPTNQPTSSVFLSRQINPATSHQPAEESHFLGYIADYSTSRLRRRPEPSSSFPFRVSSCSSRFR